MWLSLWELTTIGKQNIYGLTKMKTYLSHLIEYMQQAVKTLPAKPYLELSEDDECLRGVIEYESIEPKPMQEWFGIDKANFPPAEKLSNDELELMVKEIIK
ncbi:MAG: hypothetical protein KAX05_09555, partial [Bacteroidales bacterium]|nr:hypothetical protein [Bacteroidales bacterium]